MENTAIVLIVITNAMLVLILGTLAYLVYRLIKNQGKIGGTNAPAEIQAPEAQYHPAILERMKELQKVKPKRADLFCPNHTDEPGEASCAICDRLYCKACIKPFKALHFCREHMPLIMRYDWDEVLTVKTSTQNPEDGVKLYDAKKKIYEEKNLPSYIETHYKINVDHDYIETYLVLYAIKDNIEAVRTSLTEI